MSREGPLGEGGFSWEGKAAFRFRRKERLKGRDEIGAVFKKGRSFACAGAKLFVLTNKLPHNRFAVTFARKFGNAVARNRARRISREAYRHISPAVRAGYDLVLLVYPAGPRPAEPVLRGGPVESRPTTSLRMKQLKTLFSRAGLWEKMEAD